MADLLPNERLQPSLIDRLIDDEPGSTQEPVERSIISQQQLRRYVRRDLAWLLNTTRLAELEDLTQHPHAACSVINFGVPDYAGRSRSSVADQDRGQALTDAFLAAIRDFEPRLQDVTVKLERSAEKHDEHNALVLIIEGDLWGQPLPVRLLLRTELDLEDGTVELADSSGSSADDPQR